MSSAAQIVSRPAQPFVGYFRVSTERQGRSGLGLEAQKEAVMRHVEREGGELVGEFVEVESGKGSFAGEGEILR